MRGSIPVFDNRFQKYGGNTTCIFVETGDGLFIVDTGSGARDLGNSLMARLPIHAHIFYTHTHWDHIQGFPFFVPLYIPNNRFDIYGETKEVVSNGKKEIFTIEKVLKTQQNFMFFPAPLEEMASEKHYHELVPEQVITVGQTKILSFRQDHPNSSLGFRFDYQGKSFTFSTDIEFSKNTLETFSKYNQQVQVLAFDCQYTPTEYQDGKIGWGHSTYEHAAQIANHLKVKQLHMIHHDPMHDDNKLDQMEKDAQKLFKNSKMIPQGYKFSMFEK